MAELGLLTFLGAAFMGFWSFLFLIGIYYRLGQACKLLERIFTAVNITR